ncbi:exodeoxyribonuclease V subunit beta, partial [bacterium]
MAERFCALTCPLDSVTVIEASAGTGKTYAIASLYLRLVIEEGLKVDQILVVTFTEAATEELKGRIRARLRLALFAFQQGFAEGDAVIAGLLARSQNPSLASRRLRLAINSFDESQIHTIHGFCNKTLEENAFESGS